MEAAVRSSLVPPANGRRGSSEKTRRIRRHVRDGALSDRLHRRRLELARAPLALAGRRLPHREKGLVLTGDSFKFGLTPFYFLRHGETGDSVRGILQGQVETVLSDEGRLTAWKAARVVLHVRPRSIYASPLRRAWETAEIISRTTAVPIVPLPGLKERNWGDFEGRPRNLRPRTDDPKGVESTADFRARVVEAMQSIDGPPPVLVVAHSGVYRLLCHHAGIPFGRRSAVANGLVLKFAPHGSGGVPWHIEEIAE